MKSITPSRPPPGNLTKRIFNAIIIHLKKRRYYSMQNESENVIAPEEPYPRHLGFMFKKISVSRTLLNIWLHSPDFVREIEHLINEGISIDNRSVYEAIKKIYFPLLEEQELYGYAHNNEKLQYHSRTRNGLRRLGTVLFDNPDAWESDYHKFLETDILFQNKIEELCQNRAFSILYRQCNDFSPFLISQIISVPEFYGEIINHENSIDKCEVFNLLRNQFISKRIGTDSYSVALNVIRQVSRIVKGDSNAWKDGVQYTEIESSMNRKGFGFLYNEIGLSGAMLSNWLSVPEFRDEAQRIIDTNGYIDGESAFNLMREIYLQKDSLRSNGVESEFNFYQARKALKRLSEVLYGDRNSWNN